MPVSSSLINILLGPPSTIRYGTATVPIAQTTLPLTTTRSRQYNGTPRLLVTDIANSYVNDLLGLVCPAFQLLAALLCAEIGFTNEETKGLDG